jgi:hypothetical protein
MSAFTTCSTPGVPILLSPGDSATGTSIAPTLSWEPVGSASGYVVQVCLDSGCGQVVRQAPVKSGRPGGTQWKVTPALGKTASYWWRVRAGSACGTGTWSAARRFTTGNKLAPGDVAGRSTRD